MGKPLFNIVCNGEHVRYRNGYVFSAKVGVHINDESDGRGFAGLLVVGFREYHCARFERVYNVFIESKGNVVAYLLGVA